MRPYGRILFLRVFWICLYQGFEGVHGKGNGIFRNPVKRKVYNTQTAKAKAQGVSNCPDCAAEGGTRGNIVYTFDQMEADHVTAWSNGGDTSEANCQMLCKYHNRVKGNC